MGELLRYPVTYIFLGGGLALFEKVREEFIVGAPALGSLICIYAFFSRGDPSERREIGDNCYFIGFVYTLLIIALSLGLRARGDSPDLSPLLDAVAIALATSVVGMLMRFALTHRLSDPADEIEIAMRRAALAASRLEGAADALGDAVERTRTALSRVEEASGEYGDKMSAHAGKLGESLTKQAEKLLATFGAHIADALQKTHFDKVRDELRDAVASHRRAVDQIALAQSEALSKFRDAAAASSANAGEIAAALGKVEAVLGGEKWSAANAAITSLGARVESLNIALEKLADKGAEAADDAEFGAQRARDLRAVFAQTTEELRRDVEAAAKIRDDYRREFEAAAKAALAETHKLYARLIAGAEIALKNIGEDKK